MTARKNIERDLCNYDTIFGVVIIKDIDKRPLRFKITTANSELCDFINHRPPHSSFQAFTSPYYASKYVKSQLPEELAFLFGAEGEELIEIDRWYIRADISQ